MKSISNILLVAVIIIYVFLPLFETSVWGSKTGFAFSEESINSTTGFCSMLFALIPFVACFGAIALNCQKNKLWRIGSCLFIALGLYFYYDICSLSCMANNLKITNLGIGYNISLLLLWIALGVNLLSFIPFKRIFMSLRKSNKGGE